MRAKYPENAHVHKKDLDNGVYVLHTDNCNEYREQQERAKKWVKAKKSSYGKNQKLSN